MLTAGGVLTACLGAMGFHHFTLHLRQVLEEHMHCIVQEPASGRAWPWGAAFASLFASAYGACVLMVLTVSISLEDHTLIHGGCALLFFLCLIYHLFAVHFLLWKGSAALARAGRDPTVATGDPTVGTWRLATRPGTGGQVGTCLSHQKTCDKKKIADISAEFLAELSNMFHRILG